VQVTKYLVRVHGYTLIELVVVIVVAAIMAEILANFLAKPIDNYIDVAERATLTDTADMALRRMARDVRRAVPNSVRTTTSGGNLRALEFLQTVDGGRYRTITGTNPDSTVAHITAADWLDFAPGGDAQFNILGRFSNLSFTYGTALASGHRIVIYSNDVLSLYSDAALGTNPGVITPSGTTITISDATDEDRITLSSAYQFETPSPAKRLFIMDTPVTYLCDTTAKTLTRYWGYTISSSQPINTAAAPLASASSALVANRVESCSFTYQAGVSSRSGLVIAYLKMQRQDGVTELMEMSYQIHVDNIP
jgi:MSHA biogenesis protein MshO